jgi:hypothetical protein
MAQHGAWIEIDECVNDYMDESEQSDHKFWKLWHIAFRVMTFLGIDYFYQIQSFKLPINANLTANLPANCLKWTKIGVLNDRGEIIPLTYNAKLTGYAQFSPDRLQKTQDNSLFDLFQYNAPIWYNWWNGSTFQTLYGLPSGAPFVGSYKVDEATGVILLNENYGYDYVMVECIVSPQEGQQYYVPIQFKEAMIAGLSWLDIRSLPSSRRGNLGDKRDRRKEFYNQRRMSWAQYKPLDLEQAYEWWLKNNRMCVKL